MKSEAMIQTAPYLPFKTFLSAIEALELGVPKKIDKGIWRTQSGINQGLIMSALRFLGLIDESDKPTMSLEDLVDSKESRQATLRMILERAYREVVAHDLTKMTIKMLDDAMESYAVAGSTKKKAVTFFLQAAKFADMPLSPFLQTQTRNTSARRKRGTGIKTDRVNGEPEGAQLDSNSTQGNRRTVELKSGGVVTLTVSVDPFSLDHADREFVFELIDKLNNYGKPLAKGATA